jgi:hypothetical protein
MCYACCCVGLHLCSDCPMSVSICHSSGGDLPLPGVLELPVSCTCVCVGFVNVACVTCFVVLVCELYVTSVICG